MLFQEKISLISPLSIDESRKRLSDNLEPGNFARRMSTRFKKGSKKYIGEINYNKFRINRIIQYRNNFIPFIDGEFIPQANNSTKIKLNMMPHRFSLMSLALVTLVLPVLAYRANEWGILIVILIVLPLTIAGFKFETRKAKQDLTKIFEAKII